MGKCHNMRLDFSISNALPQEIQTKRPSWIKIHLSVLAESREILCDNPFSVTAVNIISRVVSNKSNSKQLGKFSSTPELLGRRAFKGLKKTFLGRKNVSDIFSLFDCLSGCVCLLNWYGNPLITSLDIKTFKNFSFSINLASSNRRITLCFLQIEEMIQPDLI